MLHVGYLWLRLASWCTNDCPLPNPGTFSAMSICCLVEVNEGDYGMGGGIRHIKNATLTRAEIKKSTCLLTVSGRHTLHCANRYSVSLSRPLRKSQTWLFVVPPLSLPLKHSQGVEMKGERNQRYLIYKVHKLNLQTLQTCRDTQPCLLKCTFLYNWKHKYCTFCGECNHNQIMLAVNTITKQYVDNQSGSTTTNEHMRKTYLFSNQNFL